MTYRILLPAIGSDTINGDDEETDKWKHKGYVHGRMSRNGTLVYDESLQGRHYGAAYNGHYKEGGTERCVTAFHIFQSYAIDGGEHERHESRDADQTIQSRIAHNTYCT